MVSALVGAGDRPRAANASTIVAAICNLRALEIQEFRLETAFLVLCGLKLKTLLRTILELPNAKIGMRYMRRRNDKLAGIIAEAGANLKCDKVNAEGTSRDALFCRDRTLVSRGSRHDIGPQLVATDFCSLQLRESSRVPLLPGLPAAAT